MGSYTFLSNHAFATWKKKEIIDHETKIVIFSNKLAGFIRKKNLALARLIGKLSLLEDLMCWKIDLNPLKNPEEWANLENFGTVRVATSLKLSCFGFDSK